MSGVKKITEMHKSLRPSQIIASEEKVQSVMSVLQNDYIDPFSIGLDNCKLLNISSGLAVLDDKAESILNIFSIGKNHLQKNFAASV